MKALLKIFVCVAVALVAAFVYTIWRTSVSFNPQSPYELGPSFTFQADDFLIEIPDSFHLTQLTGLLEWPDGLSLNFQEYLTDEAGQLGAGQSLFTEEEIEKGAASEDLSREFGRPAVLTLYPQGVDRDGTEFSLLVNFHNGFVIFTAYPEKRKVFPLSADEKRAYAAERKRLFVLSAKEFLDSYYWIGAHPGRPEPGVFRTRLGLISKSGNDIFRYWPLKASFWSNDYAQFFGLATFRQSEEVLALCSKDRLDRLMDQWAGRAGRRTNCRPLKAGGRQGMELLSLNDSSLEKSSYRLIWEPDHVGVRGDELRLVFYMNSPLVSADKNKIPEQADGVIGRWRTMLESVRFF